MLFGCKLLRYDAPLMGYAVGLCGCKVAAICCAVDAVVVVAAAPMVGYAVVVAAICYSYAIRWQVGAIWRMRRFELCGCGFAGFGEGFGYGV